MKPLKIPYCNCDGQLLKVAKKNNVNIKFKYKTDKNTGEQINIVSISEFTPQKIKNFFNRKFKAISLAFKEDNEVEKFIKTYFNNTKRPTK